MTLEVLPDKKLDDEIRRQTLLRVEEVIKTPEMTKAIEQAAERIVAQRLGDLLQGMVQRRMREAIDRALDKTGKLKNVDRTIRAIVVELFTARFGKTKEGRS